jgi:signal transduction histidine kinase
MITQAVWSLMLATALLVYVALAAARKSASHWALLGALAGILAWDAGALIAWAAPRASIAIPFALRLTFLGASVVPPFYLFLTARTARLPIVEDHPRASLTALIAPSLLLYLGFLTNALHGRFARQLDFELLAAPPVAWAGPLFWVQIGWSYLCTATGIALCLSVAIRSDQRPVRRRVVLLALAAAIPLLVNALHAFDLSAVSVPLTYAALGAAGALLVTAITRYNFLEFPIGAREVIAHFHDGLVLTDLDSLVIDLNPAAEKLLRVPSDRACGRRLSELLAEWMPMHVPPRELDALGQGEELEYAVETPSGRWIEVRVGWVRSEYRSALGRLAILSDRTRQRRLELIQQRAQQLDSLGTLIAGISHEVNNPLAFVRSNLSHIHRAIEQLEPPGCAGGRDTLRQVVSECIDGMDRIGDIIASIRRLARKPRTAHETIDVNLVVRDAIRLASFHGDHAIPIETRLAAAPLIVAGSAEQLGQVVLNLLINARQAVSASGQILIETGRCDDFGSCSPDALIRVHDSGSGITRELRDHIFDPFFSTRPEGEGMGLGLAVSLQLVRLHGGVIEVGDSPLGGACFSVRLPLLALGLEPKPVRVAAATPRSAP